MLEPLTSKGVWAVLRGLRVSDDSLLPDPGKDKLTIYNIVRDT